MNNAYDVSNKRELFIDDFIIENKRALNFKQHTPVELPCDKSKPVGHYNSIVTKPDGSYICYYRDVCPSWDGRLFNNHPGEYVGAAFSRDGLKWELPDFKFFPDQKDVPGNAIIFGKDSITHNLAPFYDTNPECRSGECFKAVAGVRETGGLFAFYSADGINWKKYSSTPITAYEPEKNGGHMLDSLNAVFYSETEKCYVCYIRVWKTADGLTGLRSFAKITSTDFINWSEPEYLKVNRKKEHLYVSGLAPYVRAPHYYIGAATRYFGDRGSATDVVLLFSRGGQEIIRPDLEAWITPGLDPDRWLNRMNYLTLGIIQKNAETIILYHNRKKLMYRLRSDGFVSLHAGINGGSFTTKLLYRSGGDLKFNVAASAGGAFRVEVCDQNGNTLPGYSFKDMPEFYGDTIAFSPKWQNRSFADLPAGNFRLKIRMKECDLYSVSFQ